MILVRKACELVIMGPNGLSVNVLILNLIVLIGSFIFFATAQRYGFLYRHAVWSNDARVLEFHQMYQTRGMQVIVAASAVLYAMFGMIYVRQIARSNVTPFCETCGGEVDTQTQAGRVYMGLTTVHLGIHVITGFQKWVATWIVISISTYATVGHFVLSVDNLAQQIRSYGRRGSFGKAVYQFQVFDLLLRRHASVTSPLVGLIFVGLFLSLLSTTVLILTGDTAVEGNTRMVGTYLFSIALLLALVASFAIITSRCMKLLFVLNACPATGVEVPKLHSIISLRQALGLPSCGYRVFDVLISPALVTNVVVASATALTFTIPQLMSELGIDIMSLGCSLPSNWRGLNATEAEGGRCA